jgi:predicted Zn-dependent peptidase
LGGGRRATLALRFVGINAFRTIDSLQDSAQPFGVLGGIFFEKYTCFATLKLMNYTRSVLKNGLRLITVPMKDHPTMTVMVLVEAGSKYETKKENGISHFLEHMCFKGTSKRPKAIDISKELDKVGAQYNAFTSHEFTGYYAKVDYKHADRAIDVVSDIYLNSTLPSEELEREKGVIVEEINMYEDLPRSKVQSLFTELLYGDTPAGWDIAGTRETVTSFTREDLVQYRKNHYVSKATAVIVAGNIDEARVKEKIEDSFNSSHSGEKKDKVSVKESQDSPGVRLFKKDTDQAHFVMGFRTFPIYDERNSILKIISGILGGGMSSRLFQRVREEMGAGYYVGAGADSFTDHGFLEVAAGVDPKRIEEVMLAVKDEFKKLKNVAVDKEELEKVKDFLISSMYLSIETSDAVGDIFGYQEIMKKDIKTPDEMALKLSSVTARQVQDLSNEIFVDSKINFAVIGRYDDDKVFKKILEN